MMHVKFQSSQAKGTESTSFLIPLSHQGGFLTVIPRCPNKLQNAEVRAVRTQARLQQCSGIAIGHVWVA